MGTQQIFPDQSPERPRPERRRRRDRRPRPPCKACGKEAERVDGVFCGLSCQHEYQYARYIERWLAGEVDGSKEGGVSGYVKRWLKETRGEACEECGWARVHLKTGRVPLHVHHADGRYGNNRPENLRLLCPNCHSLTVTYGSLNNGNGRPWHVVKGAGLSTEH